MTTVSQGQSKTLQLTDRRSIILTTTGEAFFERGEFKRRVAAGDPPFKFIGDGSSVTIRATEGDVTYTIFSSDIIPFTGSRTLTADDNGKVLRCDDGSNVTVTVPADLPECFSCGFAMWSAGTVTVSAGSGATKRSSASALSTQYSTGSLLIMKNSDDYSAEFILSGGFA